MVRQLSRRILPIFLAVVCVFSVFNATVGSFSAGAVTQSQIDTLKQQQKETEKKKQALQAEINALKAEQAETTAKKKMLDNQAQLIQDEIDNINNQIAEYTTMIVDKTADVKDKQKTEDAQLARYKSNMRTMEENGAISYISIIFQANSFSDLLSRINDVGEILTFEETLYKQLQDDKNATIAAKQALETAKTDQEAARADLTLKEADLRVQLEAAAVLAQKLQASIADTTSKYAEENANADKVQAEINQKSAELKKQQEAEAERQRQQQQQNGSSSSGSKSGGTVVGSGTLMWPCPSCTTVTSPYGMRMHPIRQRMILHAGIDIGSAYGSTVVAADSGTVLYTSYDEGGYGYYMVVDHGNGITTLYAHLSTYVKHSGDTVKKGDTIAKSGQSGGVTGPHLHFEVSVNGSTTDPLNYLSGYSTSY